jgi:hypothetical protein
MALIVRFISVTSDFTVVIIRIPFAAPAAGFVTFVKSNAKALLTAEPSKVLRSPRGSAAPAEASTAICDANDGADGNSFTAGHAHDFSSVGREKSVIFSLPVHTELTDEDVEFIIENFKEVYQEVNA